MRKWIIAATVALGLAGCGAGGDTYRLVSETPDGNVWIDDTGLSLEDCRAAPDTGAPVQWCEREP